jgi:diguanylate cyclase (GGDEF)-like protein
MENNLFPNLQDVNITFSIGISGLPDKTIDSADKLIQCADVALYKAKQNGRNRIEVAEGKILSI